MIDVNALSGSGLTDNPLQLSNTQVDKQAFLELLVTQLKSQDPFEPMKNEEFLAQLAQFSSLESLNNIYEEMSASNLLQNSVHNALSTSLLGHYAVTPGGSVTVGSESVSEALFVMPGSGDVRIEISDGAGNVVRTIERGNLDAGEHLVRWDGKDGDGDEVDEGSYSVRVTYTSGSAAGLGAEVYTVGRIDAVRFYGGSPVILVDGREYSLSDLVEVMDELPLEEG